MAKQAEPLNQELVYPKALLGYRTWLLSRGELHPLHSRAAPAWQPGDNTAVCTAGGNQEPRHEAPAQHCKCGFNVYHSLNSAIDEYQAWRKRWRIQTGDIPTATLVVGAVVGKGKVEIHADGFRCEHAQILALFSPEQFLRAYHLDLIGLNVAADHYQVKLYQNMSAFETMIAELRRRHGLVSIPEDTPALVPAREAAETVLLQCPCCGFMNRVPEHRAAEAVCPIADHPDPRWGRNAHPGQLMEIVDLSRGWTPWDPDTKMPRRKQYSIRELIADFQENLRSPRFLGKSWASLEIGLIFVACGLIAVAKIIGLV